MIQVVATATNGLTWCPYFYLKESCVQGSCKSVKQMMDTWTLQMGYPVLNITKKSGNKYTVSQERFLYDRKANVTSKYKSPFK